MSATTLSAADLLQLGRPCPEFLPSPGGSGRIFDSKKALQLQRERCCREPRNSTVRSPRRTGVADIANAAAAARHSASKARENSAVELPAFVRSLQSRHPWQQHYKARVRVFAAWQQELRDRDPLRRGVRS